MTQRLIVDPFLEEDLFSNSVTCVVTDKDHCLMLCPPILHRIKVTTYPEYRLRAFSCFQKPLHRIIEFLEEDDQRAKMARVIAVKDKKQEHDALFLNSISDQENSVPEHAESLHFVSKAVEANSLSKVQEPLKNFTNWVVF